MKTRPLIVAFLLIISGCGQPTAEDPPGIPVSAADGFLTEAIGLETLGGVFSPLIDEGTAIPIKHSEIFSTAADNQPQVEIHLLTGKEKLARENRSLGRFIITEIPQAPRGVPQIEVTLHVLKGGLLEVTAKDLSTGTRRKITIEEVESTKTNPAIEPTGLAPAAQ